MQLKQLDEFVVLAQVRSFHQASDLLYLSQSSLSKHIMALEKELGHKLLERSARAVKLTSFGESFLPYATRIVDIEREFTQKLLDRGQRGIRNLIIGVAPVTSLYKMVPYLSALGKNIPDCKISFIERDSEALVNMLNRGECSIIATTAYGVVNDGTIASVPFADDSLIAVLPTGHFLADRSSVNIKELGGSPYIHLGGYTDYDPDLGIPAITVQNCSLAIDLVGKGIGISILPQKTAMNFKTENVVFVELDPSPPVHIFLFYKKDNTDEEVHQVIDFLTEHSSIAVE